MSKFWRGMMVGAAALALTACEKEPTGQVAAVVGDEEITLQQINGELAALQLPVGTDEDAARNIALNRVIERRLLAKVAREEGLDQTPEFFVQQSQLIDGLLIRLLSEKLRRGVSVPTEADIEQYVAERREAFEGRKFLQVDQIQFPLAGNQDKLAELEDDQSMDEVAQTLNSLAIDYRRENTEIDSTMLGAERLRQIEALPDGEPFVLPGPRVVTVAVVTGERAASRDSAGVEPLVAEAIQREALGDLLKSRLDGARAATEIKYGDGFSALENPTGAGSVTATE
ncbi:hypothetical protein [Qipengyuania vesicularis]|uniref:hypothetical protein n=1 Tax=Qipengyuania vesicularis TaxID=2867232 RepID=UPI001C87D6FC|nr:hypothetical protein [Qipengyuania vesicularis]MBX7527898.1 hypothetical protein [Qipengyuania vesicularis]